MFDEVCNVFTEGKRITNDTVQPNFKMRIPIKCDIIWPNKIYILRTFLVHMSVMNLSI